MREALGAFLGGEAGEPERLSGGASRETFAFTLDGRPLILQRVRAGPVAGGFSMEGEAALLRAAAAAGVPVAPVVAASDDPSVLGGAFIVVERLPGETIARRIQRDDAFAAARSVLVAQGAAALARIHAIDPADAPTLRAQDPVGQLRALVDALEPRMGPHPAFELGFRWLERHRPQPGPTTVVHGDFRLGNLLVDEHGLVAVLDWELAHLGDPVEDLGWFSIRAWRFGGAGEVAGLGSVDELLAAYEAAGGSPVDREALRWWQVLGTLRWGVICMLQASTHLSGASRSVELAAIGRRVCETEWDLLDLLGAEDPTEEVGEAPGPSGVAGSEDGGPSGVGSAGGLHGTPTATELVEAVREFLERDVLDATEGRVRFHTRVAANVLAIVERELAAGAGPDRAHRARLAGLGVESEAALASAIRAGALDEREREVRAAVRASVEARLRVANPAYLRPRSG